jgi:hypothetical protein
MAGNQTDLLVNAAPKLRSDEKSVKKPKKLKIIAIWWIDSQLLDYVNE